MTTYPRKNEAGETVWACCESQFGQPCAHRALRDEWDRAYMRGDFDNLTGREAREAREAAAAKDKQ